MSRLSKKVAEKYSFGAYCKVNDNGESYTAIDRQGKEYFVKQIGSSIRKGRVRPLIRREIFLLKALRNYTNIITLHEIIHDDPPSEELTMIFEVAGIPLNLLIHFLGQLDEHILFVLYQLLDGLRYIHSAGIIHSELRLQFVLMNQDDKISISHLRHAISPNKKQRIHDQCTPLIQAETWYKAPEWWLNPDKVSPAIDMWAFGCILAELYLQRPLFKIETNEDQLKKIFETIGAPKGEDLLCYDLDYSLEEKINGMNIEKYGSLRDLFENRPLVLDLLEKLLEFNPSKRLTAKEALNHRLFTQFHIPEDNERFDFSKYAVEGSDWSHASLIDIFEESQKKEIEMIILAHNIIRSRDALALFPIEIWKLIFQFIKLPSIGSCSHLVDPIFSELKNVK